MLRLLPFALLFGSLSLASGVAQGEPAAQNVEYRHVHVLETAAALPHPSLGSSSAPVTFEFFFNVGNARSFGQHKVLLKLANMHPKRLRIIYRLTDNRERSSSLAQIFGREAFEQGRFFEFLDAFYAKRRGPAANKDYAEVAKTAGIDYSQVKESLENMRHDDFLNANHFYWRRMHVPSVAGLLINGHRPARLGDIRYLEVLYDQAYEESMDALASGVKHEELATYLRNRDRHTKPSPSRFSGPTDKEPGEFQPKSPRTVNMHELLQGKRSQGPDDAKVTLVFICHLQSKNCRTMTRNLRMLQRAYKDELKLVVHALFSPDLPRQDKAQLMHESASCAEEQGAFWEYYRLAYEKQRQINFDQGFAVDLAASQLLDINVESFESCLDSGRYTAAVQEEVARVRKAGVTHVPAVAIGGLLYTGRLHFDQLRSLVDAELAPGLLGRGRSALGY